MTEAYLGNSVISCGADLFLMGLIRTYEAYNPKALVPESPQKSYCFTILELFEAHTCSRKRGNNRELAQGSLTGVLVCLEAGITSRWILKALFNNEHLSRSLFRI